MVLRTSREPQVNIIPWTKWKSLKFIFITATFVSVLLLWTLYIDPISTYTSQPPDYSHDIIDRNKLRHFSEKILRYLRPKPKILIWDDFFSQHDWLKRPRDIAGCPVDCELNSNRNMVNESDAIIFHLRNVAVDSLPERRLNGKQWWVLFNLEAPPHTPMDTLRALRGKIDWMATYRMSSDIFVPYGRVIPRTNFKDYTKPKFRHKQNLICWIVSHCNTPSQRKSYVENLKKHVPVRVYGSCGDFLCPTSNVKDCYKAISKTCKFYLSFENSLCKDYVTEKLFYALQTDMVPIVMGGADYNNFLPNHSFIDALDYDDPKDLASYLLELNGDRDKFMEYHSWKKDFEVEDSMTNFLSCDLCKKLHYDAGQSESDTKRKDLVEWWFANATCYSWKDYLSTHLVL